MYRETEILGLIISRNSKVFGAQNVRRRKARGDKLRSPQEHDYMQAIIDKIKGAPNDVMHLPVFRGSNSEAGSQEAAKATEKLWYWYLSIHTHMVLVFDQTRPAGPLGPEE